MQIYIIENQEQQGPFSIDEIRAKVEAGECGVESFGWHDGLTEWLPIREIVESHARAAVPDDSEARANLPTFSIKNWILKPCAAGKALIVNVFTRTTESPELASNATASSYSMPRIRAKCAALKDRLPQNAFRPVSWFGPHTNKAIVTVAWALVALMLAALFLWLAFQAFVLAGAILRFTFNMVWFSRIVVIVAIGVFMAIWGLKHLSDCPPLGSSYDMQRVTNLKVQLGLFGSIILLVGVFTPIVSMPIHGNVNFFRNGAGEAWFVLILAALSFTLTVKKKHKGLWWTGVGALLVLATAYLELQHRIERMRTEMEHKFSGNPFRGLGDMMIQSVQLQWGWAILVIGAALVIASAAIRANTEPRH